MRKVIFWTHLICGVAAALVILMMSVTGVILTYERQMLEWSDRAQSHEPTAGATPLPMETLLESAIAAEPAFRATSIVLSADPRAPAAVSAGRSGSLYVDRYTGELLPEASPRLRAFFSAVTGWHRWFNATGESRGIARAVTGASNLVFLFLIFSGAYLWLPLSVWKWPAFKTRLLFNGKATTSQARDHNWHHVFGFWSLIPLAVVVATAVVFSYGWANDLVYRSFGEEPPDRGGATTGSAESEIPNATKLGWDTLAVTAAQAVPGWRTMSLQIPAADAPVVRFNLDKGNGGQPQLRYEALIDAYSAKVREVSEFGDRTPGSRARTLIRYLHTGEALGLAGQTVAGIVSLTSVFMVWTGLALAYRRLIAPLFRRRRS